MDSKIGGTIQNCPAGGHNVNVHAAAGVGSDKVNAAAGVFAAGNTLKGPVTTGAFAEANAHGHGLSIQHSTTPGVGSTFSENARLNVLQSGQHSVDLNALHSRTKLDSGLSFDKVGGNVAWNHAQGHSASIGMSQIPKFDMKTVEAAGKANLWTSPNRATTLDMTGSAQRHLSGPFAGKNDFGAGFGFTHRF